ncbi:prepilin-type N-terminal cleavage/methylation domain-containing protein [Siccibacter colletis]|uniref:Prepilin-type N-terminal cleavage/methylation domain-containing protein n=1 Tax=Siccibacter colletis TaxID=1505757 RepID=A0ABY6JCT2_9ENTR|nr:prepilin-type N-terminal cleavage/methylation domain-containing protein [Siccibacter colletis]UYU31283.1 prepilin-type N-terminal cleavage/methylation domain-containing protein [Siccibacter colletis]
MQTSMTSCEAGFSLIEVMMAMVLMVLVSTSLMGYHRVVKEGFNTQWQYRQLWRIAQEQADILPPTLPVRWKVSRMQTSGAGCVSITATVTSPSGREGQLTRRHCPVNEISR